MRPSELVILAADNYANACAEHKAAYEAYVAAARAERDASKAVSVAAEQMAIAETTLRRTAAAL